MKVYIGIDAHSTNYTLSSYNSEADDCTNAVTLKPEYEGIVKYAKKIKEMHGPNTAVLCGYEAGCLGYTLYKQLTDAGVACVIMAPSTIATVQHNKKHGKKTDKRDACSIAKALAYGLYSKVYVPDEHDVDVREYIRMRSDHKKALKKIKQQILAFCLRNGYLYTETAKWTQKHISWLRSVEMRSMQRETLDEYMIAYDTFINYLDQIDTRIEEIAQEDRYKNKVAVLRCLKGIDTLTALALVSEISDFSRFSKADQFASYLGLVPGQDSSSDNMKYLGITKAGNSHLRTLLVEAAQTYSRGSAAVKSKALKSRQSGNDEQVIAYADKAKVRLSKKFRKLQARGVKYSVATAAIARELACFTWGLMTDHIN